MKKTIISIIKYNTKKENTFFAILKFLLKMSLFSFISLLIIGIVFIDLEMNFVQFLSLSISIFLFISVFSIYLSSKSILKNFFFDLND